MTDTYTYTARDAQYPHKVLTFTLYDDRLRINLTDIVDQAGELLGGNGDRNSGKEQLKSQIKPAMMKMVERLSGPVHLRDVETNLEDDRLTVTTWKRVGGLRLAPIVMQINEVDNPDAADGFVEEVESRAMESEHPGAFSGVLDYWLGWAGIVVLALLLLRRPSRRRRK